MKQKVEVFKKDKKEDTQYRKSVTRSNSVLVIHHNKDADGIFSGLLATDFWESVKLVKPELIVDIIGYNYEPFKDWMEDVKHGVYGYIQFIDITPPIDFLETLGSDIPIDIFDHHEKACERIRELGKENINIYFDPNMCGAKIYHRSVINLKNTFLGNLNVGSRYFWNSDYRIFKRQYKKLVEKWSRGDFICFVEMISSYDTWSWYEDFKTKGDGEPMRLSLGLMCLYEKIYYSDLPSIHSLFMKQSKNISSLNESCIIKGVTEWNKGVEEANSIVMEDFEIEGNKLTIVIGRYNFFVTEKVRTERKTKGVIFIQIDLGNRMLKMSGRTTDGLFDMANFVETFSKKYGGNGGGHKFAAGGTISIKHIDKLIHKK